jgi:HEAT repeat protein
LVVFGPASSGPLSKALKHENSRVRQRALAALGQMGENARPALPSILHALSDPDAGVRSSALGVLGNVPWAEADAPTVLAGLRERLQDRDANVRAAVTPLVPRFGPEAVHVWIAVLESTDPNVRRDAAVALAQFGHTRAAVPALTSALRDADGRVRTQAAITLWQIDQQRQVTTPILIAASLDPDANTRREAMKGLIAMEGFPLVQPRTG